MSYNGHKNYETWAISMYIDGNYTGEGTCRKYESLAAGVAAELKEEDPDILQGDVIYALAEHLQSEVTDELIGEVDSASIVSDLLKVSLSEVDWEGLAEGALSAIVE